MYFYNNQKEPQKTVTPFDYIIIESKSLHTPTNPLFIDIPSRHAYSNSIVAGGLPVQS